QDTRYWEVWTLVSLIDVESVFLESGKVDDAEVRASRCRIRCRLAEVISSRLDELSGHVGIPVNRSKHLVCRRAEVGCIKFIGAYLAAFRVSAGVVANRRADPGFHREEIRVASVIRRGGFTAENCFLRKSLAERWILRWGSIAREIGKCRRVADAFAL